MPSEAKARMQLRASSGVRFPDAALFLDKTLHSTAMKTGAFPVIAIVLAIALILNAAIALLTPIVRHYWWKYQHRRIIEQRRQRFYKELRQLMTY